MTLQKVVLRIVKKLNMTENNIFVNHNSISINYDTVNDVLYAKLNNEIISYSNTEDDDTFVIYNYNNLNKIVGLQILSFSEASKKYWQTFKNKIPSELFNAVENWIASDD